MAGKQPKVLVAMSGGVDSSVAAALLVREGFEVVGCFMRLGSPGETLDEMMPAEEECVAREGHGSESRGTRAIRIGHQGCCSINDAADARLVAARLGVPFYVCNFKKDFGRVIDYFADEYAAGRTPNPCVRCNDWLKFGKLREYAGQIGAEFVASGHYARLERRDEETKRRRDEVGEWALLRGVDEDKDQSYVLFGVAREQLGHMMLPVGGLRKARVRELAKEFGLPVFDKPDSQEICFVPDNDYAGLVERRRPEVARAGAIVDRGGNVVGEHGGQHKFTIGQRRGLNVAAGRRLYVVGKDVASNTVTVGDEADLLVRSCVVHEANWLVDVPREGVRVMAKYRYNTPAAPAVVEVMEDGAAGTPSGRVGRFRVTFDEAQVAVAPGQAMVVYGEREPERVLGGGWIA